MNLIKGRDRKTPSTWIVEETNESKVEMRGLPTGPLQLYPESWEKIERCNGRCKGVVQVLKV